MRDSRRTRLVLVLLLVVAFALITLDYRAGNGSPFGTLRTAAAAVFGPIERAVAGAARPVGDAFSSIGHLGSYKKRIASLEKENSDLRAEVRAQGSEHRQLQQLQKLTGLAGRARFRIVAARVVAMGDALGFEWTATIDAGSRDGVRPNMTVLNGDGLVGRVKKVGPSTATVVLAIDGQSYVGARLARSGEVGTVQGQGQGRPLMLTLFSATADLKKGQQLVTWGSVGDNPFVPEVPIGTVTEVLRTPGALTRTALVKPFVDFGALDTVGVVVAAPRTVPRDSLLPAAPAARAASPSSSG